MASRKAKDMHGIIKKSKIIALVVFLYAASAKGVTVHEPYGSYPFDDTSTSIPCATIEHKNFDAIDNAFVKYFLIDMWPLNL